RDHETADRAEPVRTGMSTYVAEIEWSAGPEEDFRRGRYSRVHEIRFDNGLAVRASASPSVVPQPFADPSAVDPEDLMGAALSSGHVRSCVDLARRAGVTGRAYHDMAEGILERNAEGRGAMTTVTLRPRIDCDGDRATLDELHHKAHEVCSIANS